MNVQKIVSSLVIFVSMSAGAISYAQEGQGPATVLPSASAVLPDTLAFDTSSAALPTVKVAPKVAKVLPVGTSEKTWQCGQPRALTTDAVQTVKVCEYR